MKLFDDSDYTMAQFPRPKPTLQDRINSYPISSEPLDVSKMRPWSAPAHMITPKPESRPLQSNYSENHLEEIGGDDFEVV